MYTEVEQKELSEMPDRTPLGQACQKFLEIKGKVRDLNEKADSVASEIMVKMQDEGKSFIRLNGWEFEMKSSAVKLAVHAIKGHAESAA